MEQNTDLTLLFFIDILAGSKPENSKAS